MDFKSTYLRSVLFVFAFVVSNPLQGSIILQPTDLAPGDQYRLVFVTSTLTEATSDDINYYNNFVDNLGDLAMTSDWTAIASTQTVNARDNTGTTGSGGVPIYNLNGIRVADDYADLWDTTIDNPIKYTEVGDTVSETAVWTGTEKNGTTHAKRYLGTLLPSGNAQAHFGYSSGTGNGWIQYGYRLLTEQKHLYGISQVQSIPTPYTPTPEPASLITWTLFAAVGCIGAWWRRHRAMG
ncbi:MAG: PEP-CTERM sorting domain-containing protein [Planctomycetaceae bacterium]|nr:PEP-CTERM sorting domain-containing protein [Planctomycetaceae bacterium]